MSSQLIALIIGAGRNIGQHAADTLVSKGFKVALASRSAKQDDNDSNQFNFQVNLVNQSSIPELFSKVKAALGAPSVVIYNASASSANNPKNVFSLPLEGFTKDMHINTTSAYAAAQQATFGFEQPPESAPRMFIYTGNAMNNNVVIGPTMSLGVGKSATAHLVQAAVAAYAGRGFKYYYVDERTVSGEPIHTGIGGEGHALHFVKLIEDKAQGPWQQTFVTGKGYRRFESTTPKKD